MQATLKELIVKNAVRKVSIDQIVDTCDLINDLGYDSILVVQLIIDIEEAFGFEMEDEDMNFEYITKYSCLEAFIESKLCLKRV